MNLYEAHALLTDVHANYELVVHWKFAKDGNTYEAEWRPEGGMGFLSEFPVEVAGDNLENVLAGLVESATAWKQDVVARARERAEQGKDPIRPAKRKETP